MAIPQLSPYEIPPLPTNQAAHWQLDPKRAALLVHDMQEYFITAYDRNANPMSTVLSNIQSIISFADSHGMPVFFSAQPPAQHCHVEACLTTCGAPASSRMPRQPLSQS